MKQAAGEKASVAGSRSPPGSLCEDRVRDSAEDTTLGHRDNTAPPNSERAERPLSGEKSRHLPVVAA